MTIMQVNVSKVNENTLHLSFFKFDEDYEIKRIYLKYIFSKVVKNNVQRSSESNLVSINEYHHNQNRVSFYINFDDELVEIIDLQFEIKVLTLFLMSGMRRVFHVNKLFPFDEMDFYESESIIERKIINQKKHNNALIATKKKKEEKLVPTGFYSQLVDSYTKFREQITQNEFNALIEGKSDLTVAKLKKFSISLIFKILLLLKHLNDFLSTSIEDDIREFFALNFDLNEQTTKKKALT